MLISFGLFWEMPNKENFATCISFIFKKTGALVGQINESIELAEGALELTSPERGAASALFWLQFHAHRPRGLSDLYSVRRNGKPGFDVKASGF